jgi:anti-anti-sigma factor
MVRFTDRRPVDQAKVRDLSTQLEDLETTGEERLLVDFSEIEHLTSQGLSELISLNKKVRARGGGLTLVNLSPAIFEVLRATRLDRVFGISDDAAIVGQARGGERRAHEPENPVLLFDEDRARSEMLAAALAPEFAVTRVDDMETLKSHCEKERQAAVILLLTRRTSAVSDRRTSSEVWQFIRSQAGQRTVMLCAARDALSREAGYGLVAAGVSKIIDEDSPRFVDDVRQSLRRLRGRQLSRAEESGLKETFAAHGLISHSASMWEVFRSAVHASEFDDLPVLILGETGTGKEVLARAIHALDRNRGHKPFVAINCAGISKALSESDLFGHARGAFTGADSARLGMFRSAHGGTLVLDEIGDLDRELQPKLLRVLQERRLVPVGEDCEHSVDVRVIAATNRPLEQMVAAGEFRADLYERLNVLCIRIPPLRERPEDIEVQARHFLALYQSGKSEPLADFSEEALEALRLLSWGGNTRQLQNLVRETLARKPEGPVIELEDLPRWVVESLSTPGSKPSVALSLNAARESSERETEEASPMENLLNALADRAYREGLPLSAAVDRFERSLLHLALERNNGNRTQAAERLGMSRKGLLKKLKRHSTG